MPRAIEPAEPILSPEGIPFSPRYGDVYHSTRGGLAQARHVFLGGNGLPAPRVYFLTSGQLESANGWKASAAGMVATSLE